MADLDISALVEKDPKACVRLFSNYKETIDTALELLSAFPGGSIDDAFDVGLAYRKLVVWEEKRRRVRGGAPSEYWEREKRNKREVDDKYGGVLRLALKLAVEARHG